MLFVTWVSFGLLLSLGTVGGFALVRARGPRPILHLACVFFGVLATTTLFHPSTRYLLPMIVALAPLAGIALSEALRLYQRGHRRYLFALLVLAVGFGARNATRSVAHPGMWQLRVAEAAAVARDIPECRSRVSEARRLEPESSQIEDRAQYVISLLPPCGF